MLKKVLIAVFFLFVVRIDTLAQCAMCRSTLESNVSTGEIGIAAGINLGILYLFAAPYLAIGTVAFFWYKHSKKNTKTS